MESILVQRIPYLVFLFGLLFCPIYKINDTYSDKQRCYQDCYEKAAQKDVNLDDRVCQWGLRYS